MNRNHGTLATLFRTAMANVGFMRTKARVRMAQITRVHY